MIKLIGLAGTFAAGKDTVAEYLQKQHGFLHVSTGDLVREEAKRRGMSTHRDNLVGVGNDLRESKGADVLVSMALDKQKAEDGQPMVISGIRNPKEVETLKAVGGKFVFVDAPIEQRYERAKARGRLEDHTNLEGFKAQEERELSSNNPAAQNISAIRELADLELDNSDSINELNEHIEAMLGE